MSAIVINENHDELFLVYWCFNILCCS